MKSNWQLPQDGKTLDSQTVSAILQSDEYPEVCGYTTRIEYVDFSSYGQDFTQAVIILHPLQPRLHKGRKVVVVGGEAGSEYGGDFLETVEGKDGPGVWLAKRGITFVGLTRVGRWNFLDPHGKGSWETVPLGRRMPIFHRRQAEPWGEDDFTVELADVAVSASDSAVSRLPREGTPLFDQMLAANSQTYVRGYQLAIQKAVPPEQRDQHYLLYWGMSTGGAFLYALARHYLPDGYLGWGTSTCGLASALGRAKHGDFSRPYRQSAMKVRERGYDDFVYYTKDLDEASRKAWWQNALKSPRFKSGEDPVMLFSPAALTEVAMRLWQSDFLPADERRRGFGHFLRQVMEPAFVPEELKSVAILEMNGTRDEAIPPHAVDAHRETMEFHAGKYRVARIQDFQHYLFTQESIKVVGTMWLRFIDSGFFDLE